MWSRDRDCWKKASIFFCSLAAGNFHRKASVIMVDELLSAYPHQLSFSEAGLRIMITSHFPPKTRLSMASRMLINEVCLISPTCPSSEFAFSCSSVWLEMQLWCFFWIPGSTLPYLILLTVTSLNHPLLSVPMEILAEVVTLISYM